MRSGVPARQEQALETVAAFMESTSPQSASAPAFDLAIVTDVGTERAGNEDSKGHLIENGNTPVFVVADGVGGYEGGEVASAMAVETTLKAFRESPPAWGTSKRLHRAVQQANIEIHNRALTVPELRRMATTCTAVAINVDEGMLFAAHVGDCRLYLLRNRRIEQISRDHTMVGERVRMGIISSERGREHPDRSALSRSLGHDLIASIDRITTPLQHNDRLILCSDGLWSVLEDRDLERLAREGPAEDACRRLIEAANRRGTADNLTAAVFVMHAAGASMARRRGWRARLLELFKRAD